MLSPPPPPPPTRQGARQTRQMEALHDRNRMLEHAGEVSPAALAWLAGGAAAGGANPHHNTGVEDGEERGTNTTVSVGMVLGGAGQGDSLIRNPVVLEVIRRRRREAARKPDWLLAPEQVFAPRVERCTEDYVAVQKARRTVEHKTHGCWMEKDRKKDLDLHGAKHNMIFPDYMHFVHIPKAGGTSLSKVLRRMMCTRNNGTNMELDCCNVGWCDFQKGVTCQVPCRARGAKAYDETWSTQVDVVAHGGGH